MTQIISDIKAFASEELLQLLPIVLLSDRRAVVVETMHQYILGVVPEQGLDNINVIRE